MYVAAYETSSYIKNALEYNVYHRCLCYFLNECSISNVFLCVMTLRLSGIFKGHKIAMGFFWGLIFGPGFFWVLLEA